MPAATQRAAPATGPLAALGTAVRMAERQCDDLRRSLQDTRRAAQAAQAQLGQLQGYAEETQGRWGMRAGAQVQPEVLFHHMHFMDRLHHAMGLQSGVMADQERRVAAAQQALLAGELRLAGLKKLLARRLDERQAQQNRSEQKQTDERAALQYRTALNPTSEQGT